MLQQLQQQDLAASLEEMVQRATNTFYNREQERKAKVQEREKRKETRHAQMLVALQGNVTANPKSLKDRARGEPALAGSLREVVVAQVEGNREDEGLSI